MRTEDYITIAYVVMAVITAIWVFARLRDPIYYRVICSVIVGAFWPIPVGLVIFLYLEGLIVDAAKWITEHFD